MLQFSVNIFSIKVNFLNFNISIPILRDIVFPKCAEYLEKYQVRTT